MNDMPEMGAEYSTELLGRLSFADTFIAAQKDGDIAWFTWSMPPLCSWEAAAIVPMISVTRFCP